VRPCLKKKKVRRKKGRREGRRKGWKRIFNIFAVLNMESRAIHARQVLYYQATTQVPF
jgi:hypothetical protein